MKPHRLSLIQLKAMIQYEILMGWRRGAIRSLLIFSLMFPQLLHLLDHTFIQNSFQLTPPDSLLWVEFSKMQATAEAIEANIIVLLLAIFFLPILFAEIIPLDREYKTREVIDALPLPPGRYFAGKIVSVWIVVILSVVLSASLNGLLSWVRKGPFSLTTLIEYWLTGLLLLSLFSSQFGVVLAANAQNRKYASIWGLVAIIPSAIIWFISPGFGFQWVGLLHSGITFEKFSSPGYFETIPGYPTLLSANMLLRISIIAASIVGVWFLTVHKFSRMESYDD